MTERENYDVKEDFKFIVEDVFTITGRGTVVTGPILSGVLRMGDLLHVQTPEGEVFEVIVSGIEMLNRHYPVDDMPVNIGILLKELKKEDISRGTILLRE